MDISTSVFVGNLPYDVAEETLVDLFRPYGEVIRFRLPSDASGKGKGYGFCDFATVEGAEAAKKMNGIISFNGRHLRVDSASQPPNVLSSSLPTKPLQQQPQEKSKPHSYHTGDRQAKDLEDALKHLTYGEAYGILVEMRAWIKRDPGAAKILLNQRPVLAQALLKIQTHMAGMQFSPNEDMAFGTGHSVQQQQQQPIHHQQQQQYMPPPPPQGQEDMLRDILAMSEAQVALLESSQQAQIRLIRQNFSHLLPRS